MKVREAAIGTLLCFPNNANNQMAIAKAGAIKPLILLLSDTNRFIKVDVLRILRRLARNAENREVMIHSGAIESLVLLFSDTDIKVRANALTLLGNFAFGLNNKKVIANAGAIAPLVLLLSDIDIDVRAKAASVLLYLSVNVENEAVIIQAGAIRPLVLLLNDINTDARSYSIGVLRNLAVNTKNQVAIVQANAIPILKRLKDLDSNTNTRESAKDIINFCKMVMEDEDDMSSTVYTQIITLSEKSYNKVLYERLLKPLQKALSQNETYSPYRLHLGSSFGGEQYEGFNVQDILVLSKALPYIAHSLEYLELDGNHLGKISDDVLKIFFDSLAKCHQLYDLYFTNNDLGAMSIQSIIELGNSWSKCRKLQRICLDNNQIHAMSDDAFDVLCWSISKCSTLMKIPYNGDKLNSDDKLFSPERQARFEIMLEPEKRETFRLNYEEWISCVGQGKKYNEVLYRELLEPLRDRQSIITLNLNDANLNEEGMLILAKRLPNLSSLKNLFLRNNNLGDMSLGNIKIFSNSLQQCENLNCLNLENNNLDRMSDETFDVLCWFLVQCENLESIFYQINNLSPQREKQLTDIRRRSANRTLIALQMSYRMRHLKNLDVNQLVIEYQKQRNYDYDTNTNTSTNTLEAANFLNMDATSSVNSLSTLVSTPILVTANTNTNAITIPPETIERCIAAMERMEKMEAMLQKNAESTMLADMALREWNTLRKEVEVHRQELDAYAALSASSVAVSSSSVILEPKDAQVLQKIIDEKKKEEDRLMEHVIIMDNPAYRAYFMYFKKRFQALVTASFTANSDYFDITQGTTATRLGWITSLVTSIEPKANAIFAPITQLFNYYDKNKRMNSLGIMQNLSDSVSAGEILSEDIACLLVRAYSRLPDADSLLTEEQAQRDSKRLMKTIANQKKTIYYDGDAAFQFFFLIWDEKRSCCLDPLVSIKSSDEYIERVEKIVVAEMTQTVSFNNTEHVNAQSALNVLPSRNLQGDPLMRLANSDSMSSISTLTPEQSPGHTVLSQELEAMKANQEMLKENQAKQDAIIAMLLKQNQDLMDQMKQRELKEAEEKAHLAEKMQRQSDQITEHLTKQSHEAVKKLRDELTTSHESEKNRVTEYIQSQHLANEQKQRLIEQEKQHILALIEDKNHEVMEKFHQKQSELNNQLNSVDQKIHSLSGKVDTDNTALIALQEERVRINQGLNNLESEKEAIKEGLEQEKNDRLTQVQQHQAELKSVGEKIEKTAKQTDVDAIDKRIKSMNDMVTKLKEFLPEPVSGGGLMIVSPVVNNQQSGNNIKDFSLLRMANDLQGLPLALGILQDNYDELQRRMDELNLQQAGRKSQAISTLLPEEVLMLQNLPLELEMLKERINGLDDAMDQNCMMVQKKPLEKYVIQDNNTSISQAISLEHESFRVQINTMIDESTRQYTKERSYAKSPMFSMGAATRTQTKCNEILPIKDKDLLLQLSTLQRYFADRKFKPIKANSMSVLLAKQLYENASIIPVLNEKLQLLASNSASSIDLKVLDQKPMRQNLLTLMENVMKECHQELKSKSQKTVGSLNNNSLAFAVGSAATSSTTSVYRK